MQYFLAGYYVISRKTIDFGTLYGKSVHSCSTCINDSLLDHWSYPWTTDNNGYIDEIKGKYQIDDDTVYAIREWVDTALNEKKIGWINIFRDLAVAQEYRNRFFSHLSDVQIFGLYFSEEQADALIQAFPPSDEFSLNLGLYESLLHKTPAIESDLERTIGFDIVGIELDGSFHTFYCHDIAAALAEKFGLVVNHYGLFDDAADWIPVAEHMNDEESGYEPVPWLVGKITLVS